MLLMFAIVIRPASRYSKAMCARLIVRRCVLMGVSFF